MLNLKVGNIFTDIEGVVSIELYSKLQRDMAFRPLGYEFSTMYNKWIVDANGNRVRRMWDGWRRQIWKSKKRIYFPTGLLSLVKQCLDKKNVEYQLVNCRIKPVQEMLGLEFAPNFTIRDYQQLVVNDSCSQQRGIIQLPTGSGKCLGKGTPVLMFNGSITDVENIVVGDLLMGPDSKPRKVLSVASGIDDLYRIKPKRGESFVVNASHILSLRMTNGCRRDGEVVNVPVYEYLKQNKYFKHCAKGYRSQVDFTKKKVPIDPYFLGLWLGDGRSTHPEIFTADSEIVEFLENFAFSLSMKLNKKIYGNKCPQYAIISEKKGFVRTNKLLDSLRKLEVINNKHVPHIYKANSRSIRLKILSGLMDSDGSLHSGGYDYISKYEQLANDVAYLSRSLGLRAIVTPCLKTCTNTGSIGKYFRVGISGECSVVPVKITRKKAPKRKQKKNCLHFGFEIKPIGKGEYYGFEIDGDRLFMLGDFTVTHNTIVAGGIIQKLKVKPFIFFVTSIDLLIQAKESFEEILRDNGKRITVGQIGGGSINIQDINVMTVQTAVRALGEKWDKDHKFDSDDQDDKTPIHNKADVLNLLKNAKGSISDECQHWKAETCQLVARSLENAYYTYGMSATPYRDDGDDMMIQACFGKNIVELSASQLIREKWLIRPSIKIVHVRGPKSKFRQWQQLYKDQVTENVEYNEMVASIANSYIKEGRLVLVLVQQIKHGKILSEMIPGSVFLSGTSSKKVREENINKLRNREISCITSTVIFDEGIDVRPLDTVLLAGQGRSRVRAMQRIGRIMRPFPGKTVATAVDFRIHQKYLLKHSIAREKMYRTEEEYNIEEIDTNE